jgi:hypothetical protein
VVNFLYHAFRKYVAALLFTLFFYIDKSSVELDFRGLSKSDPKLKKEFT